MTTRSISFAEGEFYHVYNRGTDKRIIYEDIFDYQRFQELLYLSNSTLPVDIRGLKRKQSSIYDFEKESSLVSIGAYCLMPNHFHILLTPLVENGVSLFMNKMTTSYSMYFNSRYKRTGGLFEGTFKAQHVSEDVYLKYLFSYIHLNPVKLIQSDWKEKGIRNSNEAYEYAASYDYSSLKDFLDEVRKEKMILHKNPFPEYFNDPLSQKSELLEWIEYDIG